jgi:predicted Zn-dependent protease
MIRRPFLPLALCVPLGLAACATVDRGIDKGASAAADVLISSQAEAKLGNQLAAQVNEEERISKDAELQAYLDKVANKVLSAVPKDQRNQEGFTFTVIDKPTEVNAFALPGGHIYVYSGLIAAAGNEAELAGVLAHEIGHATSRHGAEVLVKSMGLETVMGLALGQDPNQLAALGAQVAAQGYLARNSRDQEREADARALTYLTRAGYDPNALPSFFEKLAKMQGSSPGALASFFASHPDPADRAKTARTTIARSGKTGGKQEIVGNFAAMKARAGGKSTSTGQSTTGSTGGQTGSAKPGGTTGGQTGGTTGSTPPPPAKPKVKPTR